MKGAGTSNSPALHSSSRDVTSESPPPSPSGPLAQSKKVVKSTRRRLRIIDLKLQQYEKSSPGRLDESNAFQRACLLSYIESEKTKVDLLLRELIVASSTDGASDTRQHVQTICQSLANIDSNINEFVELSKSTQQVNTSTERATFANEHVFETTIGFKEGRWVKAAPNVTSAAFQRLKKSYDRQCKNILVLERERNMLSLRADSFQSKCDAIEKVNESLRKKVQCSNAKLIELRRKIVALTKKNSTLSANHHISIEVLQLKLRQAQHRQDASQASKPMATKDASLDVSLEIEEDGDDYASQQASKLGYMARQRNRRKPPVISADDD